MYFNYQKGRINFTDSGEGKVIVLLHGYLESLEIWRGLESKLAKDFRIISVDLPGCGLSDVFGETHTMEFMATSVKELLDYLKIEKAFLTGHSLGGYVALAFLELYQSKLSGYCLFHSSPFADTTETIDKRKREIEIVRMGKKNLMYPDNVTRMFATSNLERFSDALQRSKDIASQTPDAGIIAVLNGMMQRPSRQSLMEKGIVPCLWILGEMDNYIPCDAIQAKVRLPANAQLVILHKSGHMGFIEEEDNSHESIMKFINHLSNL
jgi:pimeloyl-ACP methyl ester carboxylesterase